MLVLVNKAVLSTFKFPHYRTLTAAQSLATLCFMLIFRKLGLITFRGFRFDIARKVAPMRYNMPLAPLSTCCNAGTTLLVADRRQLRFPYLPPVCCLSATSLSVYQL